VSAIRWSAWQLVQPQLARGEMAQLLDGINGATGIWIPFVLCTFGFAVGLVVLAWGLFAAHAITAAMATCAAIGGVLRGTGAGRNGVRHSAAVSVFRG
jgi:hypothetical protein